MIFQRSCSQFMAEVGCKYRKSESRDWAINHWCMTRFLITVFYVKLPRGLPIFSTFGVTGDISKNGSYGEFSSVAQSCPTLFNPMDCSIPDFPVHHQLLELAQTHVHRVGDAIQPSHPLSSPSPPAFNLFQCQDLFQWVSSSHHMAKILEFQLQHQSFQWIFRTDFL